MKSASVVKLDKIWPVHKDYFIKRNLFYLWVWKWQRM